MRRVAAARVAIAGSVAGGLGFFYLIIKYSIILFLLNTI